MSTLSPTLLELWRVVGRHHLASESLPPIARLLAEALPLRALVVHELVPGDKDLRLLAEWHHAAQPAVRPARLDWNGTRLAALERWSERAELASCQPGQRWVPVLHGLETPGAGTVAMAGALR